MSTDAEKIRHSADPATDVRQPQLTGAPQSPAPKESPAPKVSQGPMESSGSEAASKTPGLLKSLAGHARNFIKAHNGPLTRELVREPGQFGLGQLPLAILPEATTTAVCGFCSTGCGLRLLLKDGEAVGLVPAKDYPVNAGMACPKGWEALAVLDSADRGTVPLLKSPDGKRSPVAWDDALRTMVEQFRRIQSSHGSDAVAFLSTGQMATEEMALLGAVAKFGLNIKHGDGNTRQCMATAVVAYKQSFGFDAPPYTYADFEASDCLVFVGANPAIAHPILWERVTRNRNDAEIIVVDPRRTETAMGATLHLPCYPKADIDLFYGLAHLFIRNDWIDRSFVDAHTNGFAEYAQFVEAFTPERVGKSTRLGTAAIIDLAHRIRARERVSFWWTMGVNQSHQGTRTAQAIINLALLTGNIGRPGTGANSITGQCNAMGSRLFSNTTNLLGGYDFGNPEHREKVSRILEISPSSIPNEAGWAYPEIVEGILRGKIRGLWVIATNPAHSWINQGQFRDILGRLDFLVVQDMYHSTETAAVADLYLPAAGWGEKDGTFINSERRIGVHKKVRKAPGQALADFSIFRLVAEYAGVSEMFARWTDPEAAFQIMKELSAGQPCDFSGIESYHHLDRSGGIQWPFTPADALTSGHAQSDHETLRTDDETLETRSQPHEDAVTFDSINGDFTQRRLFADGQFFHPDGKARFMFEMPRPLPEPPSERYPFILLTGRSSAAVWHTRTRTDKSAVLKKLAPTSAYVEINPLDARGLRLIAGQSVMVESQRGNTQAKAVITAGVPVGQLFMPMHDEGTNELTDAVFDPYSRQPAYKACAVRISTVE